MYLSKCSYHQDEEEKNYDSRCVSSTNVCVLIIIIVLGFLSLSLSLSLFSLFFALSAAVVIIGLFSSIFLLHVLYSSCMHAHMPIKETSRNVVVCCASSSGAFFFLLIFLLITK